MHTFLYFLREPMLKTKFLISEIYYMTHFIIKNFNHIIYQNNIIHNQNMLYTTLFIFLVAAVLSSAPPILIKYYVVGGEKNLLYIFASLISALLLLVVYIKLARTFDVSKMFSITKILSILIVTLVGFKLLKERITTKSIIGIFFGIIALILLSNN